MNRLSRTVAGAVLVIFAATACTINPYTGEKQAGDAGKGAGIGAGAGAVLGLLMGGDGRNRRKNALIGAGIGALAGGGVGYYMDVQEAKLRQKLQGTGVSVTRKGDDIVLNMPSKITFPSNGSDLNSQFFPTLDSVALVLKEYNKTVVDVAGHTDSTGQAAMNQALSERRANTVGDYLVSRGIPADRVMREGYGATNPIASNATPEGRAQNRRVEIVLSPITQPG
jgi:outer membrane protein OmpA-like peptidoglycan-associated protein